MRPNYLYTEQLSKPTSAVNGDTFPRHSTISVSFGPFITRGQDWAGFGAWGRGATHNAHSDGSGNKAHL
jgi:hypothetical protein